MPSLRKSRTLAGRSPKRRSAFLSNPWRSPSRSCARRRSSRGHICQRLLFDRTSNWEFLRVQIWTHKNSQLLLGNSIQSGCRQAAQDGARPRPARGACGRAPRSDAAARHIFQRLLFHWNVDSENSRLEGPDLDPQVCYSATGRFYSVRLQAGRQCSQATVSALPLERRL